MDKYINLFTELTTFYQNLVCGYFVIKYCVDKILLIVWITYLNRLKIKIFKVDKFGDYKKVIKNVNLDFYFWEKWFKI